MGGGRGGGIGESTFSYHQNKYTRHHRGEGSYLPVLQRDRKALYLSSSHSSYEAFPGWSSVGEEPLPGSGQFPPLNNKQKQRVR